MTLKAALFGCHKGETWCRWGYFDHNQVLDQMRWNFFQKIEWLLDRPRSFRFFWANNFSYWAHRLRGGKAYDLGYCGSGNRAAHLEDSLRFRFIPPPDGMDADDANEALCEIEELGQLARATTWIEE